MKESKRSFEVNEAYEENNNLLNNNKSNKIDKISYLNLSQFYALHGIQRYVSQLIDTKNSDALFHHFGLGLQMTMIK